MFYLIQNIHAAAEDFNVYGDVSPAYLRKLINIGQEHAAMEVAGIFTDLDGGEAPDEFYEQVLQLIDEQIN